MRNLVLENASALLLLPVALAGLLLLSRRTSLRVRGVSAAIRVLSLTLIVVALALPSLVQVSVEPAPFGVTILCDVSDSMEQDASQRDRVVEELKAQLGDVRVDVMDFAAGMGPRGSTLDTSRTDLQRALEMHFVRTARRPGEHVVVVSDGRENRGMAARVARWFAARGGAVHTLGVGEAQPLPPTILRVEPSVQNEIGRPIRFTGRIEAPMAGAYHAVLLDGNGQEQDRVRLQISGQRSVVLTATPTHSGAMDYRFELRTPEGAMVATAPTRAYVKGPPAILLVDPFHEEAELLASSAARLGLRLEQSTPEDLPEHLGAYGAIILSDLAGSELTSVQRRKLREHVESGSGLIFVGGSNVVSERWAGNELAALLPFEIIQPKPEPKPKREITVCYVVDNSGSMAEALDSRVSKLDLVKAAIQASLRDLPDEAKVAVVVFDTKATLFIPPTSVAQRDTLYEVIDRIGLGGGTSMAEGIDMGLTLLAKERGERYIVVLTDGVTSPPLRGWDPYIRRAQAADVNWTSIAVGQSADQALMQQLARATGGQYFFCGTASRVPKVFITQARQVGKEKQQARDPFTPSAGPAIQLLSGITDPPELIDALDTETRKGADVILLGRGDMPLLASWRVGLGQVIAFSGGVKTDWAAKWAGWGKRELFWTQLIQRCLRPPSELYANARVVEEDGQLVISMAVTDAEGKPVNNMRGEVQLGQDEPTPSEMRLTRPGIYEVSTALSETAQSVHMLLTHEEAGEIRYAITYAPRLTDEARLRGVDEAALSAIAEMGNGVYSPHPATIAAACIAPPPTRRETRHSLVPWLAGLAIALWLTDVATRKSLGI